MKKVYIQDPLDTRWNDLKPQLIGALDGKVYVEIDEDLKWTPVVKLPKELQEVRMQKLQDLKEEFITRVDEILNSTAQSKGYDSINTAVSYAAAPNEFYEEGKKFFSWRSKVYYWGYGIIDKVKSGELNILSATTLDKLLDVMPKFEDA